MQGITTFRVRSLLRNRFHNLREEYPMFGALSQTNNDVIFT